MNLVCIISETKNFHWQTGDNRNYAKFHFRDPKDNHIYKFESVSPAYCLAWLEDHFIIRAKLIYFVDVHGNILIKEKDYKPN